MNRIVDKDNGIAWTQGSDGLHAVNGVKIEVWANVDGEQRFVDVDSETVATMIWNQLIATEK